ncbi:MAG: DUF421 domain-containing protein [Paenibacillaceae bacterium]|nr:DUF421 domain-containing protein [Paenibacillaceae bacterium]
MPTAIEITLRTLASIATLFLLTKLIGKRQVSELSVFEYITGITLGSMAAYISLDLRSSWTHGVLSLCVWVAVSVAIEYAQLKSRRAQKWIDGTPTVLIRDGKIMEENLKKERLTIEELLQQLRTKDVFLVSDVQYAVMEANGTINVLLTKENQPLTPKQLGITVQNAQEPATVIIDGSIVPEALATRGLSLGWLHETLDKQGLAVDNIVLAQVDGLGQLTVDTFDDQLTIAKPQEPIRTYVTIKKCIADLESFALATRNSGTKKQYAGMHKQLLSIANTLKPLLLR